MHRPTASRKQVVGLALTLTIGTGVGVGLATTWSASGAATPHTYLADTATVPAGGNAVPGGTGETTAPGPSSAPQTGETAPQAPSSAPLTLEEAKAIATQTAPGRVVEWDEDQEPTGLRYDLTVLHADRTTSKVEVDTVTRQITSISHDDDVWD
jgi:hypothetical protein